MSSSADQSAFFVTDRSYRELWSHRNDQPKVTAYGLSIKHPVTRAWMEGTSSLDMNFMRFFGNLTNISGGKFSVYIRRRMQDRNESSFIRVQRKKKRVQRLKIPEGKSYQYTSLSARSVRVIELQPGVEDDDVTICFTEHSVDSLPSDCRALSYTWGDPTPTHKVSCGQKILGVTRDIWLILKTLRHQKEPQRLWIDGLCINQKDMNERSAQVLLMGDIYRSLEVVVWLGEENASTPNAFRLIRQLRRTHEAELARSEATVDERRPDWGGYLEKHELPSLDSPDWKDLETFFWKPWYYRMWIVQEVALARSIIVHCGKHWVTWQDIESAAYWVNAMTKPQTALQNETAELAISAAPVVRLSRIVQMVHFHQKALPLEQLLILTKESVATFPVDKIYGLLGVASDPVAASITPSYSLPFQDVFRSLAETLLSTSLDVLSQVATPYWLKPRHLPSWVPDWSQPFLSSPLVQAPFIQPVGPFRLNCSGTTTTTTPLTLVRFSPNRDAITVSGVVIGKVASAGYFFYHRKRAAAMYTLTSEMREAGLFHALLRGERLASRLKAYPTGEDVRDAYARTLVADLPLPGGVSHRDAYADIRDEALEVPRDRVWREAVLDASMMYLGGLDQVAFGRRFFVTDTGYMGVGPFAMTAGDWVVALCGGKTPYLLHRVQKGETETFRFDGEAYVHGVMDGEVFQGTPKIRDFVLV